MKKGIGYPRIPIKLINNQLPNRH